jgi:glucose-1-phosphate cytidylyltransferase
MKTVLLAGGYGTRLSEYTEHKPKPMLQIGGRPILWHIMQSYAKYGHQDFYCALGYKGDLIKEFFLNYRALNSDFTINLNSGNIQYHHCDSVDWKVTLMNTGEGTMTGGRVKRMQSFINGETFMVTYGDGVANIDINLLIDFHRKHGRIATVSAVRPVARFGELQLDGDCVNCFKEKPQLYDGWINGGYFVFEPEIFEFIDGDLTLLEREPLERLAAANQLMAFRHNGFWQCMDTKRDHDLLESLWKSGAPWI